MKLSRLVHNNWGLSLVELAISIAILGFAVLLLKVGINFMTMLSREKAMIESREQAQAALYGILSQVRSANSINIIEDGRLVYTHERIQTSNMDPDTNPNLFTPANQGTVSLEFMPDPRGGYLRRTFYINGASETLKLMRGMLLEPNATNYMFGNHPPIDTNPPFVGVEVVFRLTPAFHKDVDPDVLYEKVYRGTAMMRRAIE